MNAKITLSHSDFHRYKIKGFSEAQDFFKWKSRGAERRIRRLDAVNLAENA